MSGHQTYQPQSAFMRWMERRLPIAGLVYSSFVVYPVPRNLNYWWTFGGILAFMLGVQIVTGIVLAMHYTPHVDFAFNSVEQIMRDVNYGWLLRYLHANGASMFFLAAYIHMFRGMYYGSYKEPREVLWILGVILLLLMIITGFMGYVLPWGQMSFWAATVITNLFSAIPVVGEAIVSWLWGGFAVGNPTLNRFYSLHYLLPFVIVGVVVLHIWALHMVGQNNPTGIEPKTETDTVAFTPYATIKDSFFLLVFCVLFGWFVFYIPNFLGHPDNYIPANPAVTPTHIVPEWYYLPFYAILRAIPNKLLGVVALGASILILALPAVARHLEGALRALPSALSAVLLAVRDRLRGARLARIEAAGRQLRAVRADLHRLLLRLFPDHPANIGPHRENQAAAQFHHRSGAERGRAGRRFGAAAVGREGLSTGNAMAFQRTILAFAVALAALAGPALAQDARHAERRRSSNGRSPDRSENSTAGSCSAASRSIARSARSVTASRCCRSAISPSPADPASRRRRLRSLPPNIRSRPSPTTRATSRTVPAGSPIASRRRSPTTMRRARATTRCRRTCR